MKVRQKLVSYDSLVTAQDTDAALSQVCTVFSECFVHLSPEDRQLFAEEYYPELFQPGLIENESLPSLPPATQRGFVSCFVAYVQQYRCLYQLCDQLSNLNP